MVMANATILAPAAVLILWSLIVMFWMTTTRLQAFNAAGITLANAEQGSRYADVEADMPASVNWKSHNYTHLMEQPTLFYGVIAVLALAGDTSSLSLGLAWAYTGLRIVHSLWQCMVNKIPPRVVLFFVSSLCLLGLAINAVRATLF